MDSRYVADFEAMLDALRRRGFTFLALSQQLDVARTSLQEYGDGLVRPKHDVGERIIGLYCGVCAVPRDAIPVTPAVRSAAKAG